MVSIIFPVYNGAQYIDNIVNCLRNQKYTDIEAIFIDDGSNDNSFAILKSYQDLVQFKFVIYRQENRGVSAARNKGIELASGDYVCFVDIDDDITEDYIKRMVQVLKSNDCEMVICKHVQVPSGENYVNYLAKRKGNIAVHNKNGVLQDYLYGRIVSGIWTIMIKRSLITSNKLAFAEGYKYSEDLHMVWRLLAYSNNIAIIDDELYIYRMQMNSATSSFNEERFHGLELMNDLESFFENTNGLFSKEFKRFAAARIVWSITWQAANNYDKDEFMDFINRHNTQKYIRRLIMYKNIKVSVSSILFLVSKSVFYHLSRLFGKKLVRT